MAALQFARIASSGIRVTSVISGFWYRLSVLQEAADLFFPLFFLFIKNLLYEFLSLPRVMFYSTAFLFRWRKMFFLVWFCESVGSEPGYLAKEFYRCFRIACFQHCPCRALAAENTHVTAQALSWDWMFSFLCPELG